MSVGPFGGVVTLSTGVELLDEALSGGVPAGSVVVLSGAARGRSHRLVDALVREHETRYVTTLRGVDEVRAYLTDEGADPDRLDVGDGTPNRLLDRPRATLSPVPDGGALVVDSVDRLETADEDRYVGFLTTVAAVTREADGMALLHRSEGAGVGRLTFRRADCVLSLRADDEGDGVDRRLVVDKLRGGTPPNVPIDVDLSGGVELDASRYI
ncbi:hypothetical protein BRD17_10230 [Halobacteriales archaeon SW_7_68_16]|nr:MAG: hypothetical protein BRD17_10230 [Halobacteriales archaeon SW_7_68_16]